MSSNLTSSAKVNGFIRVCRYTTPLLPKVLPKKAILRDGFLLGDNRLLSKLEQSFITGYLWALGGRKRPKAVIWRLLPPIYKFDT